MDLRKDSNIIIEEAIKNVLPDTAVKRALEGAFFGVENTGAAGDSEHHGKLILVAIGKAAWQMAKAASEELGDRTTDGIVITKYGHVKGNLGNIACLEAGHPVPDKNTFTATQMAIDLVYDLTEEDTVLFLVSGGGSALFEKPMISGWELSNITEQLLASGADIGEINTIRKRLSAVKGGRFAKLCEPAKVFSIVLSDVLGDRLDVIASGPAYPDSSTCRDALRVVRKYDLRLSQQAMDCLALETPKELDNVTTVITGSVKELCASAIKTSRKLGYEPVFITDCLTSEAREAGVDLAKKAFTYLRRGKKIALIEGGETVVKLKGPGMGGRNQELALSAAELIQGKPIAIFSVGSDGTDGPTDAAGGFVDGETFEKLGKLGIDVSEVLEDNDSYTALKAVDGLIVTGPTGTNVNDLTVALIDA